VKGRFRLRSLVRLDDDRPALRDRVGLQAGVFFGYRPARTAATSGPIRPLRFKKALTTS
jgi:hypothetical protein